MGVLLESVLVEGFGVGDVLPMMVTDLCHNGGVLGILGCGWVLDACLGIVVEVVWLDVPFG